GGALRPSSRKAEEERCLTSSLCSICLDSFCPTPRGGAYSLHDYQNEPQSLLRSACVLVSIQLRQAEGDRIAHGGHGARKLDGGIPENPTDTGLHRGHSGQTIGQPHHVLCNLMTLLSPCIQAGLFPVLQRFRQRSREQDGVLDARVHSLSAGWTVNMRRVAA